MTIPKELSKFGLYNPRNNDVRRRLVAVAVGEPGTGKSDLMLRTAPRPLLILNIDQNLEPIEGKYAGQDDVLVKDIRIPRQPDQAVDLGIWNEMRELYETCVVKDLVRSVLIDTGDALNMLLVRAIVGNLEFGDNGFAKSYGEVSTSFRAIFNMAKQYHVNLLMTHRMADEYAEAVSRRGTKVSKATGRRKRAGWKDAEYEAQLVVLMGKDGEKKSSDLERFTATVTKCNGNPEMEGEMLRGEEISWTALGLIAAPWSKAKEWA